MVNMRPFTAFEQKNMKFLVNHNVKFTQVEVTPTGLKKSILDSTAPMRAYFIEEGVHNYEEQLQGQEYKEKCDVDGTLLPAFNKEIQRRIDVAAGK